MRKIMIAFVTIFFTSVLPAQTIEKYFDFQWKECEANMARFYGVIQHTDSGWVRHDYFLREKKLQMKGLYKDSGCTFAIGQFYFFHANGNLKSMGRYKDNKKEGLWVGYYSNKNMSDSTVYVEGEPTGTAMRWYNSGYISDSTVYNDDGSAVSVSWFEGGPLSEAGRLSPAHNLHGKWQFFHRNGKLSASELYDNGRLIDRKYFSENGAAMTDTTDKTHPALFAGGLPGWQKYLAKSLYFPSGYVFTNGDRASVVAEFTIDENGEIKDIELPTPFHFAFDDIVMKVLKTSPKWEPAMNHNRKVRNLHRQAINFRQERL